MTFRQLGWRQLAEAEENRSTTVMRNLKVMGGEFYREIQNVAQGANRAEVEQAATTEQAVDPLAKYDQATVLLYGITAWSYPDRLNGENIGTLDEATARWAALQILDMGKPPDEKEVESSFFGSQGGSMATPATQTVAVAAMLGSTGNGSSA